MEKWKSLLSSIMRHNKIFFYFMITLLCFLFDCCGLIKKISTDKFLSANSLDSLQMFDQKYRWMLQFDEFNQPSLDSLLALPDNIKYRVMGERFRNRNRNDSKQPIRDSIWKLQKKIDSSNFEIAKKQIFEKNAKWNSTFETILWHQRNGELEKLIPQILEKVNKKKIPAMFYAQIIDNMEIQKTGFQIYGTIYSIDKNGKEIPPKIKDIKTTNQERKKIGLKKIKIDGINIFRNE